MGARGRPESRELYTNGILACRENDSGGSAAPKRDGKTPDGRDDAPNRTEPAHARSDSPQAARPLTNTCHAETGFSRLYPNLAPPPTLPIDRFSPPKPECGSRFLIC